LSETEQIQYKTVEYPPSKEVWGPAYWTYLHTSATQYPANPNRSDKLKMKELIRNFVESIPCEDPCQIHARKFIKNNPPALDNRKSLLEWTCALHNSVNEKLGKDIVRCVLVEEKINCPNCRYNEASPEDKKAANAAAAADIEGSMKMYRKASVEIIHELSKKHNVPEPKVVFAACPLHPDTSCIEWKKEDLNDKGLLTGPAIIYLNPYAASFKTPAHEFQHYLDLKKGRGHNLSEYEANRFAYEILGRKFPHDTVQPRPDAASAASESEKIDPLKIPLGYEYGNFKNWEERFPAFKSIRDRARKKEEPQTQQTTGAGAGVESQEEARGITSYLDSMYAMPAEWSGVRSHDLNMAYTPEFITNSIMLLLRSNLSNMGSAVVGFVTSLALMAIGIFGKQGLTYGDRQLIVNLSASFLMGTLNYANPKIADSVIFDGKYLINAITNGKFGMETITSTVWETPEMYRAKEHKKHMMMEEPGISGGGGEVAITYGPGFSGATETVRAQQEASQRSYDVSRPGGAISLSQGPFGRSQRVIGRNPRRLPLSPSPQSQPPGQAMFVSGSYQNFSGFGGSSPGVRPPRRSMAADDTDIDIEMNPDTYGSDSLDY
jgi:Erv1 / Alr family